MIRLINEKQEVQGPHRSPEKQFLSIIKFAQNYDIPKRLLRGGNYLLFENWMVIICKILRPLHKWMLCVMFSLNWPRGSWRKFSKLLQFLFAISLLSFLGKGRDLSFQQTWIPFTQGCFALSLVVIGLMVQREKIFKFRQCNFAISLFTPLEKTAQLFIKQN